MTTDAACRVLVVDDEQVCVRMLESSLTDLGFKVQIAFDGAAAIEIGRVFKPHVLVSDWKLRHVVDGVAVAQTLQGEIKDLAVILFSGSPSDDLRLEARDVKISAVLEKPIGIDDVVDQIYKALGSRTPECLDGRAA